MAQTLSNFYQAAQDYGFSRDYQARVTGLVINGANFSIGGATAEKPLLYIKDFAVPGAKRIVSTVKYLGADVHSVGPRTFGDTTNWSVTFYSDQNLLLRQWLEARLIESATNTEGRLNFNPVPGSNSYATIDIVNDNLETVLQYKIEGLFIVELPSMAYNLAGDGKIQEIKVTFGYRNWVNTSYTPKLYDTRTNQPGGGGILGGILGGLRAITQVANAVGGAARAVRGTTNTLRETRRSLRGR